MGSSESKSKLPDLSEKEKLMIKTVIPSDVAGLKLILTNCKVDLNTPIPSGIFRKNIYIPGCGKLTEELKIKITCRDLTWIDSMDLIKDDYKKAGVTFLVMANFSFEGCTIMHVTAMKTVFCEFLEKKTNPLLDYLKLIVEYGGNIHAVDLKGNTPLHYVARTSEIDFAKYLIDHETKFELLNENKESVFDIALKYSQNEMYQFLKFKQMNSCTMLKRVNQFDFRTEFVKYAKINNLDKIKHLINTCVFNVNMKMLSNMSMFIHVSDIDLLGKKQFKKYLYKKSIAYTINIKNGRCCIYPQGNYNRGVMIYQTMLHNLCACSIYNGMLRDLFSRSSDCDKIESIVLKLFRMDASANEINTLGETPLHLVARSDHLELAKILMKNSADPKIKNNAGMNCYDVAFKCKSDLVANYLKPFCVEEKKITDVFDSLIERVESSIITPLASAPQIDVGIYVMEETRSPVESRSTPGTAASLGNSNKLYPNLMSI